MFYFENCVLLAQLCITYGGVLDINRWEDVPEECGKTRFDNYSQLERDPQYSLAKIGEFPFMVRVGVEDQNSEEPDFYCGGSLISRHYVLSEIYCAQIAEIVRLGENNIADVTDCDDFGICSPPTQDIKVYKHIFAKDCYLEGSYDIAVLELIKPAIINEFVQTICIPDAPLSTQNFVNDEMVSPGWGKVFRRYLAERRRSKAQLKHMTYVKAPILKQNYCNQIYPEPLKDYELCFGYPKGARHPCVADSGGPLVKFVEVNNVRRAVLVGIAIFNPLICEIEDMPPIVFTDVGRFHKRITERIKNSMDENQNRLGKKFVE